ncbi:MAG: hypothetical protein ACE5R4_17870, partial [Armatimonadota bacterium]
MRLPALLLLASMLTASAQPYPPYEDDTPTTTYPSTSSFGTRHIDTLPRAEYPRPLGRPTTWYPSTVETNAATFDLALHTKNSFRAGRDALERLCVVEATVTKEAGRRGELILRDGEDAEVWRERVTWLGPDARYRAYWLPAWIGGPGRLELVVGGRQQAGCLADLASRTRQAFFEVEALDPPNPLNNGLGLMPAWQ